jgi:hypothetical protein
VAVLFVCDMEVYSTPGVFAVGESLVASVHVHGRLFIYPDRLVIRAVSSDSIFPRASIVELRVIRVLFFWRAIQIVHSKPDECQFVGFRPFGVDEAQKQLRGFGLHRHLMTKHAHATGRRIPLQFHI